MLEGWDNNWVFHKIDSRFSIWKCKISNYKANFKRKYLIVISFWKNLQAFFIVGELVGQIKYSYTFKQPLALYSQSYNWRTWYDDIPPTLSDQSLFSTRGMNGLVSTRDVYV